MFRKAIITPIFLFAIITFVNADKLRVNNNPNVSADFDNIIDAHDAAAEGDTIYLEPSSISYGHITILKKLVIIGPGYYLNQNDGISSDTRYARIEGVIIGSQQDETSAGSGTILTGLYIANGLTIYELASIIRCRTADISPYPVAAGSIFHNCMIRGSVNFWDYGSSTDTRTNNLTFTNNIFVESSLVHIAGSTIQNNTFYSSSARILIKVDNSIIQNNLILHSENGVYSNSTGNTDTNNLLVDITTQDINNYIQFGVGTDDSKYMLIEDSPAKGAGSNGIDVGAFGGDQPYVLSGVPAIPRIINAKIPTTGSKSTGLQIELTITGQN